MFYYTSLAYWTQLLDLLYMRQFRGNTKGRITSSLERLTFMTSRRSLEDLELA